MYEVLMFSAFFSGFVLILLFFYRSSLEFLSDGELAHRRDELPDITVVVPTYNEEENITQKLENLGSVDYPDEKYEVLVVDGGSEDGTRELAESSAELIDMGERGKIKAMNRGIEEADSRYVLFTDADVFMEQEALMNAAGYIGDGIGAVGGSGEIIADGFMSEEKKQYYEEDWWMRCRESEIDSACSLDGKFILLDTGALDSIDESSFTDDQQITLDLWKNGYRSVVVEDVVVREYAKNSVLEDINQMRRRCRLSIATSFSNLEILKKPSLYSWWIFPFRRLFNYMLPVFLGVISVFLLVYEPFILLSLVCLDAVLSVISPKVRYYNILLLALSLSWFDIFTGNVRKGCRWSY